MIIPPRASTRVLIAGAYRSGTNHVRALLELNHDVDVTPAAGFKHAPVPFSINHPLVGVVRDPLAWLLSMWRYLEEGNGRRHADAGATWHEFLRSPLTVGERARRTVPRTRYCSPAEYWNAMAYNLASVGEDRSRLVRHEDVVRDERAVVQRIASAFDLPPRDGPFQSVPHRTRNLGPRRRRREVDNYVTDEEYDPTATLRGQHGRRYGWRDRRLLRRQLDEQLLDQLGYDAP